MPRNKLVTISCLCLILILGCDSGAPSDPPTTQQNAAPAAPPPPPPPALSFAVPPSQPSEDSNADPTEAAREEPEMVAEVAAVGAGTKGHGYGGGIITEPVRAYFRTQERIVFDITIPNAMKTFKAIDPQGKGPQSHEEFMERIIQDNSIELPRLPDGHRYRYDPETEDLLVERPK